jgi:hypothetical protein
MEHTRDNADIKMFNKHLIYMKLIAIIEFPIYPLAVRLAATISPYIDRGYNVAMRFRPIIILFAVCVLSGCAHEANSYRKTEGLVNETQERTFATCRANAAPILENSGRLMGLTAYNQSISDCMRAQGYIKL